VDDVVARPGWHYSPEHVEECDGILFWKADRVFQHPEADSRVAGRAMFRKKQNASGSTPELADEHDRKLPAAALVSGW
jgi:hypothetical protein